MSTSTTVHLNKLMSYLNNKLTIDPVTSNTDIYMSINKIIKNCYNKTQTKVNLTKYDEYKDNKDYIKTVYININDTTYLIDDNGIIYTNEQNPMVMGRKVNGEIIWW